jgi:hypothetical protein
MSKVIVKVSPGGSYETTVVGVYGQSCKEADRPYNEQMTGEVVSDVPTEEMDQVPVHELDRDVE